MHIYVFISWSCCEVHRLGVKQQKWIPHLWRQESKVPVLMGLVSLEASLLDLWIAPFLLCLHVNFPVSVSGVSLCP